MNQSNTSQLIEIKTLLIDKKKFNKTFFLQVENYRCFNPDIEFIGDKILGYVNDKGNRYLLWLKEGYLRKTELEPYYELSNEVNNIFVERTAWFLKFAKINYHHKGNQSLRDCVEDPKLYKEKSAKVKAFLTTITPDMQIYL